MKKLLTMLLLSGITAVFADTVDNNPVSVNPTVLDLHSGQAKDVTFTLAPDAKNHYPVILAVDKKYESNIILSKTKFKLSPQHQQQVLNVKAIDNPDFDQKIYITVPNSHALSPIIVGVEPTMVAKPAPVIVPVAEPVIIVRTANTDEKDGAGAYINLNGGIAIIQSLPTGGGVVAANAGYNFNRGFAIEIGYTNISSSQFSATSTMNYYDVAVKGTIPFNDVFSLYGRLGAGVNYATWGGGAVGAPAWFANNNSQTNFAPMVGIGASFALSKHFDLRIEDFGILPVGGNTQNAGFMNATTAGVQFNF